MPRTTAAPRTPSARWARCRSSTPAPPRAVRRAVAGCQRSSPLPAPLLAAAATREQNRAVKAPSDVSPPEIRLATHQDKSSRCWKNRSERSQGLRRLSFASVRAGGRATGDSDSLRASAECLLRALVPRLHLTLSRSAGAKPGFALLLLPAPGQPPAPELTGTSGGLRCHWLLCGAASAPGVRAALCRGAKVRSQWVFWCLPTSSRQTGRAAALLSPGAPAPPAPRVALPGAPRGTRALRRPRPQLGLCAGSAHQR